MGRGARRVPGSRAFGETDVGLGTAGRLSAELYLSGVGIEPRGVFLGTYVRDTVADLGRFHWAPA